MEQSRKIGKRVRRGQGQTGAVPAPRPAAGEPRPLLHRERAEGAESQPDYTRGGGGEQRSGDAWHERTCLFLLVEKVFSLPEVAALAAQAANEDGDGLALFHFRVTQVRRSAGQFAIASAACRADEKLLSEYYGEVSGCTHKGGVICTDSFLPF